MKDDLKKYIEQNREEFDIHQPSPELWNRIKNNIPETTKTVKKQKSWNIGYWSIAASALLVFSIGIYFLTDNKNTIANQEIVKGTSQKELDVKKSIKEEAKTEKNKPLEIVSTKKTPAIKSTKSDFQVPETIESIDDKNNSDRKEIFDLLNNQESTSIRIEALAKLTNVSSLNHDEIAKLKEVSLNDDNTNVRLNAIEVLAQNIEKPNISNEMTTLFLQQDNPMVQMELISIISHYNDNDTNQKLIKKLQEIVLDPKTMPFVKDEAYAVLLKKDIN